MYNTACICIKISMASSRSVAHKHVLSQKFTVTSILCAALTPRVSAHSNIVLQSLLSFVCSRVVSPFHLFCGSTVCETLLLRTCYRCIALCTTRNEELLFIWLLFSSRTSLFLAGHVLYVRTNKNSLLTSPPLQILQVR